MSDKQIEAMRDRGRAHQARIDAAFPPAPPPRNWAQERADLDRQTTEQFEQIQAKHTAAAAEARQAEEARRAQVAIDAQAAVLRRALSGEPLLTAPAESTAERIKRLYAEAAGDPAKVAAVFREQQAAFARG